MLARVLYLGALQTGERGDASRVDEAHSTLSDSEACTPW